MPGHRAHGHERRWHRGARWQSREYGRPSVQVPLRYGAPRYNRGRDLAPCGTEILRAPEDIGKRLQHRAECACGPEVGRGTQCVSSDLVAERGGAGELKLRGNVLQ